MGYITAVISDSFGSIANGVPYLHSLVATGRTPQIEVPVPHGDGMIKMLDLLFDRPYIPAPLKQTSLPQPVPHMGRANPELALALQFVWHDYYESPFYNEGERDPCAALHVGRDHLVSRIRQLADGAGMSDYSVNSDFDYDCEDEREQAVFKATIVFNSVLDRVAFEEIITA